MSRPTIFTEELALEICSRISNGESLKKICEDDRMPSRDTVHVWLVDGKHKTFSDNYEVAVNIRTENMFDELTEIADDGRNDFIEREGKDGSKYLVVNQEHIQRSRLRTDVRKWYLSKIMPKKFGDKLDVTTLGDRLPTPILANINDKDEEDTDK